MSPTPDPRDRQSIQPTYDRQVTGDRYTVSTWVRNRWLAETKMADPFVTQRVTVGRKDLLAALLRGKLEVTVVVGGDRDIVEDVSELDSDYLGRPGSTRRNEWNERVESALGASA